MKICIVSSCGGHLTEVRELAPAYAGYDYFFVLDREIALPPDMQGKVYFIRTSERDLHFFSQMWQAWKIFRRERPQVILSTGAGPAVPFSIVGRWLFGAKVVFVETVARIQAPSLTGRIMYRLAHRFFYQWEGLKTYFPKGQYGGSLL
jgi:UDP-N-acetylglucosamine:LPS N-acetylglucosamine transferase